MNGLFKKGKNSSLEETWRIYLGLKHLNHNSSKTDVKKTNIRSAHNTKIDACSSFIKETTNVALKRDQMNFEKVVQFRNGRQNKMMDVISLSTVKKSNMESGNTFTDSKTPKYSVESQSYSHVSHSYRSGCKQQRAATAAVPTTRVHQGNMPELNPTDNSKYITDVFKKPPLPRIEETEQFPQWQTKNERNQNMGDLIQPKYPNSVRVKQRNPEKISKTGASENKISDPQILLCHSGSIFRDGGLTVVIPGEHTAYSLSEKLKPELPVLPKESKPAIQKHIKPTFKYRHIYSNRDVINLRARLPPFDTSTTPEARQRHLTQFK